MPVAIDFDGDPGRSFVLAGKTYDYVPHSMYTLTDPDDFTTITAVHFQPNKHQLEFLTATEPYLGAFGKRGIGKSRVVLQKCIESCILAAVACGVLEDVAAAKTAGPTWRAEGAAETCAGAA